MIADIHGALATDGGKLILIILKFFGLFY